MGMYGGLMDHTDKKPRMSGSDDLLGGGGGMGDGSEGSDGEDDEDDGEDEDDDEGSKGYSGKKASRGRKTLGKPKVKLTRGSR